jgi:hypothetical protein
MCRFSPLGKTKGRPEGNYESIITQDTETCQGAGTKKFLAFL